jgi:DNA-directed RNA polymerase specialized sigma24 family protein
MPAALQTTTREGSFASTRWTVVHQAADSQTASQHALSTLSELCQIYWRPVYVFLRRHGIPQHDAQDLTQGFFADLIESRAYAHADPRKGRFRSFLYGTLKHFLAHARDRDRAQKRGGGTAGRRRVAVPRNSAARIYRSSSGVRCDALCEAPDDDSRFDLLDRGLVAGLLRKRAWRF